MDFSVIFSDFKVGSCQHRYAWSLATGHLEAESIYILGKSDKTHSVAAGKEHQTRVTRFVRRQSHRFSPILRLVAATYLVSIFVYHEF